MSNYIIIHNTEDGKINLKYKNSTAWLSQNKIAKIFQTTKQNVSKHIKTIFIDSELEEISTVNYKLTNTKHNAIKCKVHSREVAYYNLDMILNTGYQIHFSCEI